MYFYALIELETGICYEIIETEEMIDDPSYVQIGSNDQSYLYRKKYVDGVWVNTTPAEAQQFEGSHIGIFGEWLDVVINNKADINHTHDGYATADHSHIGYVSSDDLQALEDVIDTKADAIHTHTEYASANHSHSNYSETTHSHDSDYASVGHDHDEEYSAIDHVHGGYATVSSVDELSTVVSGKANTSNLNSHTNNTEIHITDAEREIWNAKSNFSGNYNDLTNKPNIPSTNGLASEDYVDDKVGAISVESIGALPNTTVIPTVPTNVSAFANDVGYLTEHQSLDGLATETYVDTQINAIDIPSALSDLTTDSNHRIVTDVEKAVWNAKSNFSGSYNDLTDKPSIPSISGLATETYVDEAIGTKANSSHTHTITNVSGLQNTLDTKSDTTHTHTGVYDVNGAAASALTSANTYTDNAIDALSETVETKADASTLSSHTGNTAVHITSAERSKLSGIAEGANNYVLPSAGSSLGGVKSGGDVTISSGVITVNDDSHNHVISNVDGLQSALDSKAASGHNHDGVYYTETEIDTLLEGKANSSHTHTISNITNLQSTLDGKANASHGTHVSYSTTVPVMDGAASVGTATTVARSDHKHPTDTSRAAQTSLDSHTSNKSNPHGVTLAQLGVTATAAELNKMDGVTATTAELNVLDGVTATTAEINYVDGVTSNIQTQLNSKASSSHTHGTATTSAAGLMSASDKSKLDGIASGANAYTLPTASSTLGGVKTTSTVTSNSGYTACPIIGGVPYYKDTNNTYNLGSFGVTATATELNYVDGVTSNIQTQLNGKAASSHTHNYAGSSSAGGAATSANKLATARTISLAGDVTGSTSFDGSGNVSITATVKDDSHNHTIANIDGLQSAIDVKSDNDHRHYPIPIAVTEQDLNDYTDAGFYTFAQAYAPTNAPSGNVNGWLWVIPWTQNSNTIKQVWFRHGSVGSNDFETFVRTKVGSNAWGSWSKYYTTSNPPTAAEVGAISKSLQFTANNGSFKLSYNKDDGKNILTEIAALSTGFYTIYSQSGTAGNPKDTEAWRFMVHKTSANTGWVQGYGSIGSVYTNYLDGENNWRGWQCIYDTAPPILWMGEYWCTNTQTVTPSKALSKCRNGWVLVWSDYDTVNETASNGDCFTTVIPKWNPNHVKWSGQSFIAAIPTGLNDSGVISFAGKRLYVHDTKITGHTVNDVAPSNDVCLRAIYEY